jgi:predicted TPR repeat methyltransferase
MAAQYDGSYFTDHNLAGSDSTIDAEDRVAGESSRVRFVQRHAARSARRLLDVGCGAGYFCERARRAGFDVWGSDVSDWASADAARLFGLDVTLGNFEDMKIGHAPFDVVTMWHVLEHVPDLGKTIAKVREILSPGGLFAAEVPDCSSYDAVRYGDAWRGWSLPYHNWHLTPATVRRLLESRGFRVVRLWRSPSQYVLERMRALPILGIARRPAAMLFSGRDMRVAARLV